MHYNSHISKNELWSLITKATALCWPWEKTFPTSFKSTQIWRKRNISERFIDLDRANREFWIIFYLSSTLLGRSSYWLQFKLEITSKRRKGFEYISLHFMEQKERYGHTIGQRMIWKTLLRYDVLNKHSWLKYI